MKLKKKKKVNKEISSFETSLNKLVSINGKRSITYHYSIILRTMINKQKLRVL